jgi:tyrosine-protein kinase
MPTENQRSDFASQIRDQFRVLREQKWLVLLCVVATVGAAYAYAHQQRKEYRTTSKVLVQQSNLTTALFNPVEAGPDPVRQAATDAQLAKLPALHASVAKKLSLDRPPDGVNASGEGDANVIAITVEDRDPQLAARYANAAATEFIKFRAKANKRRYEQVLGIVKSRLKTARRTDAPASERRRLAEQARQLTLVSSLQSGDAQVVQNADVPGDPFEPKVVRTLVAGLIVGLLLGLLLAFLRDRLDRRLKSEEQVRSLFPLTPVIGSIPRSARGAKAKALTMESFHTLEANVGLLSPNGRYRSLLITSAGPGEGKSTVAANLALAIGAHGRSSIVLEADLRRPALSNKLKIEAAPETGVSRILVGDSTLDASLLRTPVEPARNGDGPRMSLAGDLMLVPAGPLPPNPQVLLNERALERLLGEARTRTDTVIVDGPPMGVFSDMLPVARRVDAVILAVRLYHSRRDQVQRFVEQLRTAGIEPAGIVVLGGAMPTAGYYYY